MFCIVQYTCSVQIHVFGAVARAVIIDLAIVDMDTDLGSSGVSTLAAQEANRARQRQRFDSETPEEDSLARRRARRRDRIASDTAEQRETRLAADGARRKRRITSDSACSKR